MINDPCKLQPLKNTNNVEKMFGGGIKLFEHFSGGCKFSDLFTIIVLGGYILSSGDTASSFFREATHRQKKY